MIATTRYAFLAFYGGMHLDTFWLDGQPAWIACQIGFLLDYANKGSRLCTLIRADWGDDFVEGEQFHFLTGERLAAFKLAFPKDYTGVDRRAAQLLLLTRSGLDRVLLKSDKPDRTPLRRLLEEEVLPRLAPTTTAAPAPAPAAAPAPASAPPPFANLVLLHAVAPAVTPATREERLTDQLDLRERIFRSNTLRETVRVLHALEQVDDTVRAAYEVRATEIALGEELPDLRPVAGERWYTAGDIARATGMTPSVVGRVISALGIRGAPGLSREVITTTPDDDKTVFSYVYNERARDLILGACGGSTPPGRAA